MNTDATESISNRGQKIVAAIKISYASVAIT